MKPLIRRPQLLEQAYQVEEFVEREDRTAAIVRARRIKRLQEEGIVPEPRPLVHYLCGMSVAEILRQGQQRVQDG